MLWIEALSRDPNSSSRCWTVRPSGLTWRCLRVGWYRGGLPRVPSSLLPEAGRRVATFPPFTRLA